MSIPPQEAADALRNIEHTQRHSAAAFGYQKGSPHLFLWGIIWVVGYALSYFFPENGLIWAPLIIVGVLGSFWFNRRDGVQSSARSIRWRYAATAFALAAFVAAFFSILQPTSSVQVGAAFPLMVGLWYVLMGIWARANRMTLLGLALGLLTVGGYFWLQHYFLLWMAVVGGGALILGGFWLRRV